MSTFDSVDQSSQDSQPVRFFQFTRPGAAWRYTNHPESLLRFGFTWTPKPITKSNTTMANTVPKDTIEIQIPYDDPVVAPLLAGTLSKMTTVDVFEGDATDDNGLLEWKGSVARSSRNETIATMVCEPVSSRLQRNGIPQPYQRRCRHVFGEAGCFVNREDHKTHAQVISIPTPAKMLLLLMTPPNFIGGKVVAADGSSQTVIAQNGSTITLMKPIPSVETGDYVDCYIGCDRSLGTCDTIFGNAGNFGAQPGIPMINPFIIQRSVF